MIRNEKTKTPILTQPVASITGLPVASEWPHSCKFALAECPVVPPCPVSCFKAQTDCGHEFENWRHDFSWDALQVIARLLPAAGRQEHRNVETTTILGM